MNPLLNPLFSARILKHYLTDIKRAWKSEEEIKRYQDKAIKKVVRYAYKVPLYHEKYKKAGIKPEDIRGIKDLKKLPVITKDDIIEFYPDKILPKNYKKEKISVSTSGSSGKAITIFKDLELIMVEAIFALRQLFTYGISWRKDKITNIGDFSVPKTSDEECLRKGLIRNLSPLFSFKNYQNLYTGEEVNILLNKIEEFSPKLIVGYTSVLMGIAYLRKKYGRIEPDYIISSGEVLDNYSRKYIEEAFNCDVLDLYATTEGGSIAFECLEKSFHINSDFSYLEILDENLEEVGENEHGNVVITRLHASATPIIRYIGLNDIASISQDRCNCGQNTPLLHSLGGRKKDVIILEGGTIIPPATLPMPLVEIFERSESKGIKRYQFIQDRVGKVEIRIEAEEEVGEEFLEGIRNAYEKFFKGRAKVEVREKEAEKVGYSYPMVISKVNIENEIQKNIK
ncbi:MAG: phenylacetate--CoA ligase family protein [Thermoplasmatales archaeon]|nr:phenylacetate--CoA ligase family protein [Thermoplasmatales archaeon]